MTNTSTREEVINRLEGFIERVNIIKENYREKNEYNYAKRFYAEVEKIGPKYVRIVSKTEFRNGGETSNDGVYCFINLETGNVHKAKTYSSADPKNPRSCIFDDDYGMSGVEANGVVYLRK